MKRILVSMITILMLFSFISVSAADLKELNFTSDKYEIEKGEKVVLTITSEELTAIEGTIEYDKDLWTLSNKSSNESFTLNEETGKFALANLSGEEKITVELTLKSNANTTVNSSTITISKIIASDKTGTSYVISDKEVTIKFKQEAYEEIPEETPTNTIPSGTTNSQNVNKPASTTNNTTSNVQSFPETGSESIFAVIAALGIVSGVLYFGYKKYNF